jgi:HK97 family phage major capsid protein
MHTATDDLKEVKNALVQLHEAVDKKNDEAVKNIEEKFFKPHDEKIASLQQTLVVERVEKKAADEKIAALIKDFDETKNRNADLEKRVNDMLMKIATGAVDKKADPRDDDYYKAAMECLTSPQKQFDYKVQQHHKTLMDAPELKTLRTDIGAAGGFLVPNIMDSEIRRKVTEISMVRQLCRSRPLPNKSMDVPIRDALMSSWYEGEAEPAQDTNSKYNQELVTTFRHTARVDVTLDQLLSTPFNLEAEISADASEAFAKTEGTKFIKGTGNREPQGILKDARIASTTTAGAGVMTFDDVASLIAELKSGYMGTLAFNRKTLGGLRKLKDTQNRPLWTPVTDGAPAAIWGEPYTDKFIDLDDYNAGSGAKPIVYADWMRAMEIFDMVGMMVVRDDLTLASNAKVRFIFRRWNTSRVLMPEAAKILAIQ